MVRLVSAVAVTYRTVDEFKPSILFPTWPPLFLHASRRIRLCFNAHNIKYLELFVFYNMYPVDIDDNQIIASNIKGQIVYLVFYSV